MSESELHSFGFGIATCNSKDEIIEVFYPDPIIDPNPELASLLYQTCRLEPGQNSTLVLDKDLELALIAALNNSAHEKLGALLQQLSNTSKTLVLCLQGSNTAPEDVAQAYLKLHLLSHRLAKPHSLNLDGLFAVLRNLAWTNEGPVDLDELPQRQLDARLAGRVLHISSVDKFPQMVNYVVPGGVRIADTARVRLGAYLGEGTTVMHEGFVNFNAGTAGPAMIEGRISAGVMVGANSDLGGGCSTMGTLSGGGTEIISVGENCLIGANAGIGFPLADGCVVEAGLYVTAGTKVTVIDTSGTAIKTTKARDLATIKNLLYRRNSVSGAVECVPLNKTVDLNAELHSHN